MLQRGRRVIPALLVGFLFGAGTLAAMAADPEIDTMIRGAPGKDWVTNGGNMTNQRYSTLKQIDTSNVKQLKGAWMTRLKGSGLGGKYSFEATPLVKDGIMYVVTGNDDVFALNAKTGEILWEHWSGIDQTISHRLLRLAQSRAGDGRRDAVPRPAGRQCRRARHQDRQGGVEDADRGLAQRLRDHQRAALLRRHRLQRHHRRRIRHTRAADRARRQDRQDPVAGLYPAGAGRGRQRYLAGGDRLMRCAAGRRSGTRRRSTRSSASSISPSAIAGRITTGRCARATICSAPRSSRSNAKTGKYAWHFQEVHHDIWDYDAASPVVLFDTVINGQPRKGIAQAGRTGWVYILDRTNGKPLIGIEETRGAAGAAAEDGEDPALSRSATRPCRNVPSHACQRLRKGRLHLRGVLGRAGADPALGDRRHQLVADVVQSGNRDASTFPARSEPAPLRATAILQERACAISAAPRRRRSARR